MNAVLSPHQQKQETDPLSYQIDTDDIAADWNRRYAIHNHLWGDEPSPSAQILMDNITDSSHILEVGFGYGRDSLAFCQNGHSVTGVEISTTGLTEACRQMSSYLRGGRANLGIGEFTTAKLPTGAFDAVFSHRTLHLMGNNGLVTAFAAKAARVVKPGGLLVISARDMRDFDPEQMLKRPDGLIEYKNTVPDRQGQIISLWDDARFQTTFSRRFNIKSLIESEEPEAINNPGKMAKFTIMIAERKPLSP